MMKAEPQKEHEWLTRLVGDWTYEGSCSMGPDQPRSHFKGTERVRSIGGLWIVGEGQGEMPGGGPATMLITLGYDLAAKQYLGSWVGSMMTHFWAYRGSMDASGKVLTLESEGPSFAGDGTLVKYRDVMEVKDDDHRVFSGHGIGPDGKWVEFMTSHYTRKK